MVSRLKSHEILVTANIDVCIFTSIAQLYQYGTGYIVRESNLLVVSMETDNELYGGCH